MATPFEEMFSFPQEEASRPEIRSLYTMEYDAEQDDDQNSREIRTRRRPLSLPLLTLPILGVQSVWSTEMAFGRK
jgi:hypothetical protein